MASVIVLSDGDELTVRISDLEPAVAAQKIADYFTGFSTDNETTRVEESAADKHDPQMLAVILINENADNGSGPEHDLAYVLTFTPENVRWALAQRDDGYDENLVEAGVITK